MKNYKKGYLMTMPLNGIGPYYHGLVSIDDKGVLKDGKPIKDYGCFYYSEKTFSHDRDSMFNKFLALM